MRDEASTRWDAWRRLVHVDSEQWPFRPSARTYGSFTFDGRPRHFRIERNTPVDLKALALRIVTVCARPTTDAPGAFCPNAARLSRRMQRGPRPGIALPCGQRSRSAAAGKGCCVFQSAARFCEGGTSRPGKVPIMNPAAAPVASVAPGASLHRFERGACPRGTRTASPSCSGPT